MDRERGRICGMVAEELPGHTVVFEDDDEDGNIRFLIKDISGAVVTRGRPAFHRGEIPKWSDTDLRALIRFVCGGTISR